MMLNIQKAEPVSAFFICAILSERPNISILDHH